MKKIYTMEKAYPWNYCSIGGVTRVRLSSGEDIAHLNELDQKLWTVLSLPVEGLEFNKEFLNIVDDDKDGRIRVHEVVKISEWVCTLLKNKDLLLNSSDILPLSAIDDNTERGKVLKSCARHILDNIGKTGADEISLADSSDFDAIFANSKFNGDGVIIPECAEDENTDFAIKACMNTFPTIKDRSGKEGINAEIVNQFYDALTLYRNWHNSLTSDILPYGEKSGAALNAINTIKEPIEDFFSRCKYYSYDKDSIEGQDSPEALSHPNVDLTLSFDKINPKWIDAFNSFRHLVLDIDFPETQSLNVAQWNYILSKIEPYKNWHNSKCGAEVESLGLDAINKILEDNRKDDILSLIDKDLEYSAEAQSIVEVHKLLLVYRYLYSFLNNFVVLADFYRKDVKSIFDAGELFIDQRQIKLCIRVSDMGKHSEMAPLANMYILYCNCVSRKTGRTLCIAAVLTNGDTDNLSVGMNAVFYDREGEDYDATVIKIVDNPVSIRQAFLYPYKKIFKLISERINKKAAEKESVVVSDVPTVKKGFDPTSIAVLTAGLGVGVGVVLNAVSALVKPWYTLLLVIAGLCLVISGPSMFIAWSKLRKRNLGPVLNANGWAINSKIIINSIFGATLTSLAKYPKLVTVSDPYAPRKKSPVPSILAVILLIGLIISGVFFCKTKHGSTCTHNEVTTEQIVP